MFQFGTGSRVNLVGVNPIIVEMAHGALARSVIDFSIISGRRSPAEQSLLVSSGASHTHLSAHLIGEAVDFRPYLGSKVNPYPLRTDSPTVVREKLARFEYIAALLIEEADLRSFPVQWGNDWDVDGIPTGRDPDEKGYLQDLVHIQKAPPHRVKAALERRLERIALRAQGLSVIS